jgi:hypothetical protein
MSSFQFPLCIFLPCFPLVNNQQKLTRILNYSYSKDSLSVWRESFVVNHIKTVNDVLEYNKKLGVPISFSYSWIRGVKIEPSETGDRNKEKCGHSPRLGGGEP